MIPVKSWDLPLCLVDVWSAFLSHLTSWLLSSQALCLKSLIFGTKAFFNYIAVFRHVLMILTIALFCFILFWQFLILLTITQISTAGNYRGMMLLICWFLYTKSFLLLVNGIYRWYYEKSVLFFPVFIWGKKASHTFPGRFFSITQKVSSKIISFLLLSGTSPAIRLVAGFQSCPFVAF